MTSGTDPEEERRRVFQRMEWVYVYAPPFLAVGIALAGAFLLALFVPLEGTTLLGRWGLGVGLLLGVPLVIYVVKSWLGKGG